MSNLKFSYFYRDAGNYKKYGDVTFSNPDELGAGLVEESLRKHFLDECLFVAEQIRVPECFLYSRGNATSDDHCFHELERIEVTEEGSNDSIYRSAKEFLREVGREASHGWQTFDPHS